MAKTTFNNGDDLTATFMNTIYGVGATNGHVHDGVDSDGHVKKIDLTTDTTPNLYTLSSLTMSISGTYFSAPQSGTLLYTVQGRFCHVFIPQILGASINTSLQATLSGSGIPNPVGSTAQYLWCSLESSNNIVPGMIKITSSTVLDFWCLSGGTFGNNFVNDSNNKGTIDQTITYCIA